MAKGFAQRNLETKSIRTDLIVDCVRTTESPQVQNSALLLVAGLAIVTPELVLHSVMPIFTFMGSNVLRKDDEYSAHVIDQVCSSSFTTNGFWPNYYLLRPSIKLSHLLFNHCGIRNGMLCLALLSFF
jgi:hypothetical protein